MTKAEYNKYNKEVYDKYGNRLNPGDTVVFPDGYLNDCHIGVVQHFARINVIIKYIYRRTGFSNKYVYTAQRWPSRIIKIKDGNDIFVQNETTKEFELHESNK